MWHQREEESILQYKSRMALKVAEEENRENNRNGVKRRRRSMSMTWRLIERRQLALAAG
jgi:hypothetical protein